MLFPKIPKTKCLLLETKHSCFPYRCSCLAACESARILEVTWCLIHVDCATALHSYWMHLLSADCLLCLVSWKRLTGACRGKSIVKMHLNNNITNLPGKGGTTWDEYAMKAASLHFQPCSEGEYVLKNSRKSTVSRSGHRCEKNMFYDQSIK